jgi:hypothetical protein
MMEKRQDQIPDEGFLMTKKREGKKSKQREKNIDLRYRCL